MNESKTTQNKTKRALFLTFDSSFWSSSSSFLDLIKEFNVFVSMMFRVTFLLKKRIERYFFVFFFGKTSSSCNNKSHHKRVGRDLRESLDMWSLSNGEEETSSDVRYRFMEENLERNGGMRWSDQEENYNWRDCDPAIDSEDELFVSEGFPGPVTREAEDESEEQEQEQEGKVSRGQKDDDKKEEEAQRAGASKKKKKRWRDVMERVRKETRGEKLCLIVVDVQNDFMRPSGALHVPKAEEIIEDVNCLVDVMTEAKDVVVFTQDYHCPKHASFASEHEGKKPFETSEDGNTLWPDHCVQGTEGAEFHDAIRVPSSAKILRKGMRKAVDSYSAFFENDRKTPTGLDQYVNGVNKALTLTGRSKMHACIIVGVAFDYCVRFTAEDARLYFERVVVLENATRAVGLGDSREAAREALQSRGVEISYG